MAEVGVKLASGALAKIASRLRRIPVPPSGGYISRHPGSPGEFDAIVTAVASTSNAPPLKYSVRWGHWESPTSSSQGTWTDDSGGTDIAAYALDPGMVPQPVGTYVRCALRGTDSGSPPVDYYTIFGVSAPFDCYLTQNGGDDGDASVPEPATWTYDVFIDAGKTIKIATVATVAAPRLLTVGTTPATQGLARINGTGVTLLQAYESYAACAS